MREKESVCEFVCVCLYMNMCNTFPVLCMCESVCVGGRGAWCWVQESAGPACAPGTPPSHRHSTTPSAWSGSLSGCAASPEEDSERKGRISPLNKLYSTASFANKHKRAHSLSIIHAPDSAESTHSVTLILLLSISWGRLNINESWQVIH